jgi:hypothetical protein
MGSGDGLTAVPPPAKIYSNAYMMYVRRDRTMASRKRWGWLAWLAPALICLPCLLAPLLALGGAAALSAIGGALTGSVWLAVALLLLGAVGAAAVVVARRRRTAAAGACGAPDVSSAALSREEPVEVRS